MGRLIDLSRRNRLLYFKDLKTGSLDLSSRFDESLPRFMSSDAVRLVDLSTEAEQRTLVSKILEIRRKALENLEEKGLETMHLGVGIATWAASDGGRPPAAPVLLIPVTIELRGRDGLGSVIRRAGDARVNPVLIHVLEVEFATHLPADDLVQSLNDESGDAMSSVSGVLETVASMAAAVPGFAVQQTLLLGNFSFQKMRMVQDLRQYGEELAAHDLVAALAGDQEARVSVSRSRVSADPRELDSAPVATDLLILDADSSQRAAIASALANQDGVIQGPPGTGKSQTIANAIASFIAAGKKVLFVAEKRAALEVVARRLQGCGLGHVFLDLHGADIRRSEVARRLAECLAGIRESPLVRSDDTDEVLESRRKALNEHVRRMHTARPPSGMTVYQMQGEYLRIPPGSHAETRWRGKELDDLTAQRVKRAADLLQEASATAGLFLRTDPSPWTGASISNETDLQHALDVSARLSDVSWPRFLEGLGAAVSESGLARPGTLHEAGSLLGLIGDVQEILSGWENAIFEPAMDAVISRLAPIASGPLKRALAWCFNPNFRSALKQVSGLCRSRREKWQVYLDTAQRASLLRTRWGGVSTMSAAPCAVPSYQGASRALAELRHDLETLQAIIAPRNWSGMPMEALGRLLLALRQDRSTPYLIPNLTRIERELKVQGVESLVDELRRRKLDADCWIDCLRSAWLGSLIHAARTSDPLLAAFNGRLHDRVVNEFQSGDEDRLDVATLLVRRVHAERAVAAMNDCPDQEGIVRREAGKKTRHLPVRQLLAEAPDVMLALCPCWMASPLSVSHLLDGKAQYFDVVIFDEASQVPAEDAIPSILRGRKAIVAGDRHQLPPTTFFDTDIEDDADRNEPDPTAGFESVLDIMSTFLEPWSLDWHYRSRDERLIAFSNRMIYGGRLITFPGVGGAEPISHVQVSSTHDTDPDSSSQEVRRVVDLVLEHATRRPQESLGVITMGLKHALRVEREIWRVRHDHPELREFFDEAKEERFFVKNLERVQGDERDAIVLSVGYGKDSSGRLLNRFGPLNYQGGERRLNVAVTRARQRLTTVSSFGSTDMDPSRFGAEGVRLLREYLEYASSRGESLRTSGATGESLNAFESDVFDTLTAQGLKLIPQWGVSRYRIDIVVQHPSEPGRFVLAIECDGASYHSAYTARDRDRLRQQQLEAQGWRFHRIWSTDWFLRKQEEVERAVQAYQRALAGAGGDGVARNAQPGPGKAIARPGARGARPQLMKRATITEYRQGELVALVRWILSDGVPLTDDEILGAMVNELGFKRRGARIEATFRAAIEIARATPRGT